jgi:hypothetical protein
MRLNVVLPNDPSGEQETASFGDAWDRNFFMTELWSKHEAEVARMLYGGNKLEKAWAVFHEAVKRRPRGIYTIRQRAHVLARWPDEKASF